MNLRKAEARFKRAWDAVGEKLQLELPEVMSVNQASSGGDLNIAFDADMLSYQGDLEKTGCFVIHIIASVVLLSVPDKWISAPTRLLLPETAADRLHNALLDAGVEDWIDIRIADDGVNVTAELLDTLTLGQLAALKVGYDIPLHDLAQPVYTFAERNSTVETSAPLVDPAKVETRVRQAWAGAHGGKIASIEATDDPRLFFVNHPKPVPGLSRLMDHGLEWHFVTATRSSVRVMDDLWNKIVALQQMKDAAPPLDMSGDYVVEARADKPAEPPPVDPEAKTETTGADKPAFHPTEAKGWTYLIDPREEINLPDDNAIRASLERSGGGSDRWYEDGKTGTEYVIWRHDNGARVSYWIGIRFGKLTTEKLEAFKAWALSQVLEVPPAPAETDAEITLEMYNERRREIHEREAEIERLNDRIAALQDAIRSLTPVKIEWQTLRISIKPEGSDAVPHERIAEEEAKGWTVHTAQYVIAGSFTLLVLMKREPTAPAIIPPKRVSVGAWSSNGHGEPVFPLNGSARYEAMIAEMDAELQAPATNLLNSLRRVGVMYG